MTMRLMSHGEMEAAVGCKLGPKVVMTLLGDKSCWHRGEDGVWERYPDYDTTPNPKLA